MERGEVDPERLEVWHTLVGEVERLEAETEVRRREGRREENQRARRRAAARRSRPGR